MIGGPGAPSPSRSWIALAQSVQSQVPKIYVWVTPKDNFFFFFNSSKRTRVDEFFNHSLTFFLLRGLGTPLSANIDDVFHA